MSLNTVLCVFHSDILDYADIGTQELVFPAGSVGNPISDVTLSIEIMDDEANEGPETIVLTATVSNEPLAWFFFGTCETTINILDGGKICCCVIVIVEMISSTFYPTLIQQFALTLQ